MNVESDVASLTKDDFLDRVVHSIGIVEVFPKNEWPGRGYRITHFKQRVWISNYPGLLEVRDGYQSNSWISRARRSQCQSHIVGWVQVIVDRFHWMLLPHGADIATWPSPESRALVVDALVHWKPYLGIPWHHYYVGKDMDRKIRLRSSAIDVLAALFDRLPEASFVDILFSN